MVDWDEPVEVRSLNVDMIVSFLDLLSKFIQNAEKPDSGCELNKLSTLIFYNCWLKKQTVYTLRSILPKSR